jgi:predicted ArsR family transcriptional regulator
MEGWSFLTENPQLCEAETEAFGRLLGTPVQRPATIEHGDGDMHHACHRAIARAHPQYHDRHRRRRHDC